MADAPSSVTAESNPQASEPDKPVSDSNLPDSVPATDQPLPHSQLQSSVPPSTSLAANSNLNPPLLSPPPPPHSLSFSSPLISGSVALPPSAPSFRPITYSAPHFSPVPSPGLPNLNYANPGVQPPGVSSATTVSPGGVGVTTGSIPQPMMPYQVPPGQTLNPALRHYAPIPNGYAAMHTQGALPPPGIPRYPSPYPAMIRAPFLPRPLGAMGVVPALSRPLIPGIPGIRPIISPVVRPPILPSVTPAEKPQTTVYIGRIAQTVENDFMLSLLQLCGPVTSWKRAQDPKDGTPRTFGFCEFESAEGVLRAIRLLTKFNIDGQELVLKGTQATREYLKRYVEKKTENSRKLKETQAADAKEEEGGAAGVDKNEPLKPSVEDSKEDNDSGDQEDYSIANSAVVTNEDREADREAVEKLTSAIEERLKTKPLPPPPPPPPPPAQAAEDGSCNSIVEPAAKLRDGDSDADITRSDAAEDKNDEEIANDSKQTSEHERHETISPDRSRRYDRRSRERERGLKREKERELERYERETERERVRKEREQRRKIEEVERQYEESLKDWEYREREKEKQRQYEKDTEKERERKRKKEIIYDEDDEDEDSRKRWRRSVLEEKRKKRLREKEDDLADRQKEKEEIAEAKRRADEEQQQRLQRNALKLLSGQMEDVNEKTVSAEQSTAEIEDKAMGQDDEGESGRENNAGDGGLQNGNAEENFASTAASDTQQNGNAPAKRLGFGLVGSGKRTAVPSVFHEEDDDDAQKEKRMRPLVPIDYSAEELQAVQPSMAGVAPPNLAAAAEFAKRLSTANTKEEKPSAERDRSRRSSDKSSQRDRDRNDGDFHRTKDENKSTDRDRDREHGSDKVKDKVKAPDNKKLLDAKQLIDMIPKTKEELFSHEINWAIYDKHELHERMRPWISKKITEFLGEEETTLVDYIVSSTQEHVKASQMLELLQSILDEEAEMFVLKMWRMLIFEIKKVETGLASRTKT